MTMKRMLAGASALCLLGSMGIAQAAGEFDGVTVNVITQTVVAKLTDRRFIKAHVSDILTEEEYRQLPEQKGPSPEREKAVAAEAAAEDEMPMVPMIATSPKPKKKRPRNRSARKKRSNRP